MLGLSAEFRVKQANNSAPATLGLQKNSKESTKPVRAPVCLREEVREGEGKGREGCVWCQVFGVRCVCCGGKRGRRKRRGVTEKRGREERSGEKWSGVGWCAWWRGDGVAWCVGEVCAEGEGAIASFVFL